MKVLVAFASRHGATQGIAERIAETLLRSGLDAEARPVGSIRTLEGYDAVVVGSAAYMFHWLGEASSFVKRNRAALAARPVWLFSSGPLGTEPTDAQGRDQKEVSMPREMPELMTMSGARGHEVFFGVYYRERPRIGVAERLMSLMPAARDALPEGDFRDWPAIEAWAQHIATELAGVPVA